MDAKTVTRDLRPVSNNFDSRDIDLQQQWQNIWRRKWSILSLTGIVMMLAMLVVLNMTPGYQAVSTLLIEERSMQALSVEDLYSLESSNEYLETQFELLKSRDLAARVVDQLNLTDHPEFDPRQNQSMFSRIKNAVSNFDIKRYLPFTTPDDLVESSQSDIRDVVINRFMDRVEIVPILKTQLVEIKVNMADAGVSALAANTLARVYIESQLEAKLDMTQTAAAWMNSRLTGLKQKLQESELALQRYKEQENLVDLEGITTVSAQELSETSEKLIEARRERAEAESLYRQIEDLKEAGLEKISTTPAVLADPLVRNFKAEVARARAHVDELGKVYGPKYPAMLAADAELESARENLRTQVEQVMAGIESSYQLAVANEQALQGSVDRNKDEIQDIVRKEYHLKELEFEVDTNRQLYDTFMTRLKETSATQDFEAVNARIADKAVIPNAPIKPQKSLIVSVAGVVAFFGGIMLTLLQQALSNTFKSTEDVENKLDLAVLGIVPLVSSEGPRQLAREFLDHRHTPFSESVRTIRTGLIMSTKASDDKITLITSTVPGEGKSIFSANLAASLAQMSKVLLIDADLRKPSLQKYFQFPVGVQGLVNLIADNADMGDCIKQVGNLDILPAGTVPPNPQELISSPRFSEVLDLLMARYDRIIIDSPPTLAVSDAMLISTYADDVVYVVKSESTTIAMTRKGVGHLLQNNARLTGVVLNQVNISKARKYGYEYGGYYDHYGYGEAQQGNA